MENEIWVVINDYPLYSVSNLGNVKNNKTNLKLKIDRFYKINQKIETRHDVSNFIAMIFPIVNSVLCVIGIIILLTEVNWNKFFNRW